MFQRYPATPWQERSGLAARQLGAMSVLLTVVRIHAGLSIHISGAYNVGICSAAILLVHFIGERMMGSIRGSGLLVSECLAFVTFVWMMVQREKYIGKWFVADLPCDRNKAHILAVQETIPVGGQSSVMHPMQGGPYYPDRPYGGAM